MHIVGFIIRIYIYTYLTVSFNIHVDRSVRAPCYGQFAISLPQRRAVSYLIGFTQSAQLVAVKFRQCCGFYSEVDILARL